MARVTITFGDKKVGEYPLDKPAVIIGRDASSDIHIDNLGISRAHCQFIKRGNTFILQDMNSANGTYVNGRRVGEHYLNDGDEILIGKFTLKFDMVHDAPRPKPEEQPGDMSDALRTYVVDGAQLREKLAQARGETAPIPPPVEEPAPETAPPAASSVPGPASGPPPTAMPAPAPGPPPRRAIDHALDFDPLRPQSRPRPMAARSKPGGEARGIKGFLYLSVATNIVLIILVLVLILFMVRIMARQPAPAPVRPERPAPTTSAPGTGAAEAAPSGETAR